MTRPTPRSTTGSTQKETIRAYHQRTKHQYHRFAAGPHGLDWVHQPAPFRRFEGAERCELPLDPDLPDPSYARAMLTGGVPVRPLDKDSLSRLFYDSLALSAWKAIGGSSWALRVNPSSGNLHPTEGWLIAGPMEGFSGTPGVYHYCPDLHELERRAELPADLWEGIAGLFPAGSVLMALSSIPWREAWKYGERAFRYCQHDVGHAIAAISIAAAGLGWQLRLLDDIGTEDLGRLLGLADAAGPEPEHPDVLMIVHPQGTAVERCGLPAELVTRFDGLDWRGVPNRLSDEHVEWQAVETAAAATLKPVTTAKPHAQTDVAESARLLHRAGPSLQTLVRSRRSGVDYDGRTGMEADDFFRVIESVLVRDGSFPFNALPWSPRIDLAVFVHRVEKLEPGLYWLCRQPARLEPARRALDAKFVWSRPEPVPAGLPLYLLRAGDFRDPAMSISCQQAIAGNGAFSLGMLAEFDDALAQSGAWFYSRLFWEAGLIGQRLYLETTAVGIQSTGIGCYFDDAMHDLLGLEDSTFQSLYHFAAGRAVDDPRLQTLPAYAHLTRAT